MDFKQCLDKLEAAGRLVRVRSEVDLVHELAGTLRVASVFVAVFSDESRRQMHTLAAVLDDRPLQNFDYVLEGTPCAQVVGRAFRHVRNGVAAEFQPGTLFAQGHQRSLVHIQGGHKAQGFF